MFLKKRLTLLAIGTLALAGLALAAGYHYVTSGGLIARQMPGSLETSAARWILKISIPSQAKAAKNPLGVTDATLTSGRALYQEKCTVCHGFDGSGRTEEGAGLYPPPIDLRSPEIVNATDGEIFYFIQNGIRNTAMPGWRLPDENVWQLVVFIRNLPMAASITAKNTSSVANAQHVGSAACRSCHGAIYDRWRKTLMANVVRDPTEHPEAIIPDFSKSDPLLTFTKNDIAFVYGSKWKQRYFKKVGDDYFPLPAQWDVRNKKWRPYHVAKGADWWTEFYPEDNLQRPTGPLCDGCHAVNYNISNKTVTEWNVGCEKCHGPGSEHTKRPGVSNIMNPSRLDYVEANNVCVQCHSQGQPLKKPIDGKYYDWPVGFEIGKKLAGFWRLEEHKLGEKTFTHFPDGTAHKNRMQGNDYATSLMYARGVTCFTCHDAHGSDNNALLRKRASAICLDCHGPASPNGPHTPTIEQHTHHQVSSAGSECVACHMPEIEQTLADVNVRSHTFKFIPPAATRAMKIPNSCNTCHKDQTVQWAEDALRTWPEVSPWRVAP